MKFSVIIPCHNAGRWILSALDSVKQQDLKAHEIIVIDDDSVDDSVSIVTNADIRVRLIHASVRNAAAARNVGIEAASGDWIALLDADDIWYPTHLSRAAELLDGSRDVAFMSNHDWIDLKDNVIPIPAAFVSRVNEPRTGLTINDYFQIEDDGFHFGHSTVLYRRDRVNRVGLFDVSQKRRHDVDLWLRMISHDTWTYDSMKGAGYREGTPGSISKDELECDFFYLRALKKNLDQIDSVLFRSHVSKHSRRAMGIAFTSNNPDHYARIRELAWGHLGRIIRTGYRLGHICPGLLRGILRTKRKLVNFLGQLR
jgi:glycosyltransferase involved in cell wall biosynthesis